MTLGDLLEGVPLRGPLPAALARLTIAGLAYDSRRVQPGSLFFAFPGARADGRAYAAEAAAKGAVAVVSELPPLNGWSGNWIETPHGRKALALAARRFFRDRWNPPSLTGITGTNGKTTTSYLADAVLRAAGRVTALVGTIEYHVARAVRKAANTTPESLDLYELFDDLAAAGGSDATLEVSSHALALGRVWGLAFHTAVFTNLTQDHLDFHGDMESYFTAKCELFRGQDAPPPRAAVVNWDDPYGRRIGTAPGTRLIRYGLEGDADARAVDVHSTRDGLRFSIEHEGRRQPIESPLIGRINVYNILAAYCCALARGLSPELAACGIASLRSVPGRFERVDEGQPFLVVVDYAHTADALANVLRVARDLEPRRVLTVFGCGGDRDRAKRPLMGLAAAQASDYVVVTSDNPRSEDPLAIINDALVGVRRTDVEHAVEPDREKAIRKAILEAGPGDLVLIAGKGHERYQVLKDRTIEFDDRETARRILRGFGYGKKES